MKGAKVTTIFCIFVISVICTAFDLSNLSLPEWEAMTIHKKAELMLQTKSDANKSKQDADNYINIQTLISLSPPLTMEENKELMKDAQEILKDHPEWGNIRPPAPVIKQAYTETTQPEQKKVEPEVKVNPPSETQIIANEIPNQNIGTLNSVKNDEIENTSSEYDSQNNIQNVLEKFNEQKKNIFTPDPKELEKEKIINKESQKMQEDIAADTSLYADGDFPPGRYYQVKHLDSLTYDNPFPDTCYLIEPLIIDYPINGGYICHLDESFTKEIHNFFYSEKRQFFVKFGYPTPYLKEGSTVFFSLTYPLTIMGKVKYKDTTGDMITKYICEYQGKSLHSIK